MVNNDGSLLPCLAQGLCQEYLKIDKGLSVYFDRPIQSSNGLDLHDDVRDSMMIRMSRE